VREEPNESDFASLAALVTISGDFGVPTTNAIVGVVGTAFVLSDRVAVTAHHSVVQGFAPADGPGSKSLWLVAEGHAPLRMRRSMVCLAPKQDAAEIALPKGWWTGPTLQTPVGSPEVNQPCFLAAYSMKQFGAVVFSPASLPRDPTLQSLDLVPMRGRFMGRIEAIDYENHEYLPKFKASARFIRWTADTLKGMSGAPLIEVATGHVIGIHHAQSSEPGMLGGTAVLAGQAVAISIIDALYQIPERVTLGLAVAARV